MNSKLLVFMLIAGFQITLYSQTIDTISSVNTATAKNSITKEKIITLLNEYLNNKLNTEFGGKVSVNKVKQQSQEIFVVGEFKDPLLSLGGKSRFNAYLIEQNDSILVKEFCYNKYDSYNDRKNLRCLENTKKIKELNE